jgi:hypothetical protein
VRNHETYTNVFRGTKEMSNTGERKPFLKEQNTHDIEREIII